MVGVKWAWSFGVPIISPINLSKRIGDLRETLGHSKMPMDAEWRSLFFVPHPHWASPDGLNHLAIDNLRNSHACTNAEDPLSADADAM